ncbi:MAG: hypothetical protein ACOX8P_09375 [Tepidanaerobacteraceae bacterium]|jgi:hypothetical protein
MPERNSLAIKKMQVNILGTIWMGKYDVEEFMKWTVSKIHENRRDQDEESF